MSKQYSVVANIVAKTEGFVKGLNEAKSKANEFSKSFNEKTKKISDGFDKVGKSMMTKVTLPLTALGVGATKAAIDFESAFAGVKKTIDGTAEDFKMLENGIREMAKELPASAANIASVAEAAGQLGIKTENVLDFTRTMIDLGEATNLTAEEAATSFAQFANIVGMSQENFDRLGSSVVALGNNLATTEADIVNMAMRLSGVGAQVGLAEAEIMALSGTMASVGINAEAGGTAMSTVMKKIQNAVADGGKDLERFAEASGMASEQFADVWKNEPIIALDNFIKGLSKSSEEGENLNAILADLNIKGIQESDTLLRLAGASELLGEAVGLSTDAWEANTALADEAVQRYETTASKLAMFKNRIVDVAISLGDIMLPILTKVVDYVGVWIDKFGNMSESTQKTIVVITAITAAIAPLLLAGSKLISTFGLIGTGVKFLIPLFGGLSAPIIAIVAGITALTIGGVALVNHLKKDAIPAIDLFGKEVSNTTKEVVGGFLDLNDKATQALQQLSWSGQNVTKEMKDSIVSNIGQMGNQIVQGLNDKKDEAVNVMQELFAKSTEFSEEEQRQLIENVTVSYEERTAKVQEGEQRIKEILELASEENRALKESEKAEINRIQEEMVQVGIEVLTENQREQQVILERMKQQAGEITAQQAVEVVKNSLEQKEKVVAEAEEQYNKSIAEIIKLRDEAGVISEEQAQKLIDEATRQRDETVKQAEDMHEKVVTEAQLQAEEHVNHVNWETGEILSKWQVFKNNMSKKWEEIKSDAKRKWNEMKDNVTRTVEEWKTSVARKMEEMKENIKKKFQEKVTEIKNKLTEIKTNIETKWNEALTFLKNINLLQIGKDIINGLVRGITSKFTDVKKKVEELANSLPAWMKKILGIRSPARVMIPIGEFVAEGLAVGIDRGTKKYVAFSVDNMIKAITDPMDKIKSLADDIVQIFRESYKNQLKIKNHELEKQRLFHEQSYRETLNSIDKELQLYEDAHNQKMSLLDEEMDEYEEYINQKLRMMELQEKEDDYQKQLSKEQETLSKLQSELNKRLLDDSLASRNKQRKLEEQIRLQQNKIEEMQNKRSQELRKETLKEMLDNKKKETDATRNEADQQYQIVKNTAGKERNIATQQYEFQISLLEKERMQWEEHYDYLINSERHASDIRREIYQGNFEYIKQELQAIQALTMANQSIIGQANSENFHDRVSDTISNVDDTSKMKIFNQDDLYLYTAKFINDQLMNSNVTAGTKKALEKMRDTVVGWIGDRSSTFDPNNSMSFNAAYKQLASEDKKMVANYLESFLLQQGRITDQANITTVKGLIDNLPRFHDGGFVGKIKNNVSNLHNMTKDFLQNREVLAVLEQDEFVLSKRMIESIQSNMNRQFNIPSKLATETIINNNTNNTMELNFEKLIHVEGSIDSATIPKVESAINKAFEKLGRSYDMKGLSIRI